MIARTNEWTNYLFDPAPSGKLVRFWNEYNGYKWTGYVDDLRPEFNVAYLWWKLSGIERMRENA